MEKKKDYFTEEEIKILQPNEKIALVGTINPEGLVHVSFLSSLIPLDANHMAFGEFTRGLSKENIRKNPKIGFLILTLDKKLFRGKAYFTHFEKEGEIYNKFNEIPMFRYNSYFGISTVYRLDLIEVGEKENLPFLDIGISFIQTFFVNLFSRYWDKKDKIKKDANKNVLPFSNPFVSQLLKSSGLLKFICYIDKDGYPKFIPAIQIFAKDDKTLIFGTKAYSKEIYNIEKGTIVGVYLLTMKMESIFVRGYFSGIKNIFGVPYAEIEVNYVYNSMPPVHKQIFPENPLSEVVFN